MKKWIGPLSVLLFSILSAVAIFFTRPNDSPPVSSASFTEVVDYAREHLPLTGQLMVQPGGFGYLKVDDNYIRTLFPKLGLQKEGFRPPPYFRTKESPGAHISVFYENEHVKPEEKGQFFHFQLKKIAIIHTSKATSYAILEVESPELEKLREKYGLSPKLQGHDFHISLAKKSVPKPHFEHKQPYQHKHK